MGKNLWDFPILVGMPAGIVIIYLLLKWSYFLYFMGIDSLLYLKDTVS